MYIQRNIEVHSCNHCCSGKAISVKCHECVCILASVLSYIIFPPVACLAVPFFPSCHKGHDFQKKIMEHKMCILIFSVTFVCCISHSKKIQ
jgi:hypothetical protein